MRSLLEPAPLPPREGLGWSPRRRLDDDDITLPPSLEGTTHTPLSVSHSSFFQTYFRQKEVKTQKPILGDFWNARDDRYKC